MKNTELRKERNEYRKGLLLESNAPSDPLELFSEWFGQWQTSGRPDTTAMTLATCGASGEPDARIVLLKGMEKGRFSFFTNYNSKKGKELQENPRACLMFFWPDHERQIRVYGDVVKLDYEQNSEYFKERPIGSQVGALSSPQSSVISGREELEKRVEENLKQTSPDGPDCPDFWGGYEVITNRMEFWQGRESRLHDRLEYVLNKGNWIMRRLAP